MRAVGRLMEKAGESQLRLLGGEFADVVRGSHLLTCERGGDDADRRRGGRGGGGRGCGRDGGRGGGCGRRWPDAYAAARRRVSRGR